MIEDRPSTDQQELIAQTLEQVRVLAGQLRDAQDSETALAVSTALREKVQELEALTKASRKTESRDVPREPQAVQH